MGILLTLALILTSIYPIVGTAAENKFPKITIGWTPPDITGVFKTATDYFEKAAADARKHGMDVTIVSQAPEAHTMFAKQVAIIEDFIQRGVDVIAISPIEVEVVKPAIKRANEVGIPVIIVNLLKPIKGVKVASYIGFDNYDAGVISGYAMVDYLGGPGVLGEGPKVKVEPGTYLDKKWWKNLYSKYDPKKLNVKGNICIIEGIAGGFFSTLRLRGFHSVIDKFPGIKVLSTQPADWNRQKAVKVTEDFLQRYPKGQIDAIWAASNEMGLGAMYTCETHNRTEIGILTNDGTPESVQRIREGRLIAETWHGFPEWGWYGTEFAVCKALGLEVPQIFDIRPRTEYIGNADEFYPRPKLAPIPWELIKANAKVK
ncbi:sugar ABC transporter substrate-binding protein [Candidatus Aerophobetes bacterium]|nr:sugar ABC transporter substrate-binding protein [Candidatus Aerophobetes bacterium]